MAVWQEWGDRPFKVGDQVGQVGSCLSKPREGLILRWQETAGE